MTLQSATDIFVTVSVRLPVATYVEVAQLAEQHKGNLSEALRRLLAVGLQQREEAANEHQA